MTQTPVKDKNYNLITAVQASLHYVELMETYISDAEREGDAELAEWFRKIQHNNRKAAEQGKEMLLKRLSGEDG
jgi:rubrerythrin